MTLNECAVACAPAFAWACVWQVEGGLVSVVVCPSAAALAHPPSPHQWVGIAAAAWKAAGVDPPAGLTVTDGSPWNAANGLLNGMGKKVRAKLDAVFGARARAALPSSR